jgi:hypothetical protein
VILMAWRTNVIQFHLPWERSKTYRNPFVECLVSGNESKNNNKSEHSNPATAKIFSFSLPFPFFFDIYFRNVLLRLASVDMPRMARKRREHFPVCLFRRGGLDEYFVSSPSSAPYPKRHWGRKSDIALCLQKKKLLERC